MKSLSFKFGVILIVMGFSIFFRAEAQGEDWKLYTKTDLYECFYDGENVIEPSENIVRVWTKLEYTERGIAGIVKQFGKHYENLSYSLRLWEINCAEKRQRILSITEYSVEGNILYTNPAGSRPSDWKDISSESVGENLYEAVCK